MAGVGEDISQWQALTERTVILKSQTRLHSSLPCSLQVLPTSQGPDGSGAPRRHLA